MINENKLVCVACNQNSLIFCNSLPDGVAYKCCRCGSYRLLVAPEIPIELPQKYGEAYRDGADSRKARELFTLFTRHINGRIAANGSILDIGFGDGSFMKLARSQNWDISGLEIDSNAVADARNHGYKVYMGPAGEFDNFESLFSAVTLWDLIEHVENPNNVVSWLGDILELEGIVMLVTPNAESILDKIAKFERILSLKKSAYIANICLNRYHIHRFAAKGLRELFERNNFIVQSINPVHLFSLKPEKYLSGFAPGIPGLTLSATINRWLSRMAFQLIRITKIKNKNLLIAINNNQSIPKQANDC